MVHFDPLIPNLPFVLQYLDFLWPRRPIEIPHHHRFFVLLAILLTNQEVKCRYTATDIELDSLPCISSQLRRLRYHFNPHSALGF